MGGKPGLGLIVVGSTLEVVGIGAIVLGWSIFFAILILIGGLMFGIGLMQMIRSGGGR